jgi:hypothetical protein
MSSAVHNANHHMVNISDFEPKAVRAAQAAVDSVLRDRAAAR